VQGKDGKHMTSMTSSALHPKAKINRKQAIHSGRRIRFPQKP
jgi:hypothetical protein